MTLRDLERAILAELKQVAQNDKLKLKDIMEWQTGKDLTAQEGETLFYLPVLRVSCSVKLPEPKPKKARKAATTDPPTESEE